MSTSYEIRLAVLRADAEARAEQRELDRQREEHREQVLTAMQRYRAEHGEYPSETVQRQAFIAEMHEEAERRRRDEEAADRHRDYLAGLLASGRVPRTIEQILEIARIAS